VTNSPGFVGFIILSGNVEFKIDAVDDGRVFDDSVKITTLFGALYNIFKSACGPFLTAISN
jgi:hypothetical protein